MNTTLLSLKNTFLNVLLAFLMLGSVASWGQATLPFSYDLGKPSLTTGLTQNELGSDYSTSPKMKFDDSNDNLILNFNNAPGVLKFDLK